MSDTGPWVIVAPLGRGGQGTTFRARHAETGREVALKRFQLAQADGWKAHDLFVRECETLRALDHAAIPRFVDHGEAPDGTMWLAMELAAGEPLSDSVKAGRPLDAGTIEDVTLQILSVLEYLHTRVPAVIHRDLKPANVVVAPDGWLALVDFGSVRTALRPDGGSTMVGTFGYLAPEQLHGEATAATDLYSLGMTLAALATGVDAASLPRKGLRLDLERIFPVGSDARLRDLVGALTAPDPADRPQSAAAARALMVKARVPALAPRPAAPASARAATTTATTTARTLPAAAPAAAPAIPPAPPLVLPGGPFGSIILLIIRMALFVGSGVLSVIENRVQPAHEQRRRRQIARRYFTEPHLRAQALERLEAKVALERVQLRQSRENLERFRERARPLPTPARRPALPRRTP